MNDVDKGLYRFVSDYDDPNEFYSGIAKSCRKKFLNESEEEIIQSRNRVNRLQSIHFAVKYVSILLIIIMMSIFFMQS